ncbi:MAG: glucose-phosphate cytidylyltransferase, partial [Solirubrobacteraceae bacterium]|nr:glucose-phosphate cytidylyltransferase [Solirubrobacteraceae bacterium]
HREQGTLATVTAVQPAGRFGALDLDEGADRVTAFQEKPRGDGAWINGGFFVLSPEVGRYIDGDASVWEQEPVNGLAADGQLASFRHRGFWMGMDTVRDRNVLQELWDEGRAPWRSWA